MSSVGYVCLTTRRNDQYQQYDDGCHWGAGTYLPFYSTLIHPGIQGVCVALSLVFCAVFCRSLSVLYVLFMPLYCLSLDLRLLNTCLVSLSKFFIFPNNIMFIYRNGMLYVEASWHSSYTRHSFTYRINCGIYFFKHHKWIPFSHRVCVREGREAHCPIPIPWASVGIVMGKDWKSKLPTIETM